MKGGDGVWHKRRHTDPSEVKAVRRICVEEVHAEEWQTARMKA